MAKIGLCILLTVLLFSMLLFSSVSGQGSAQSAIDSAKNTLKTCYQAVAQAEAAGANVDSLMATMNQAGSSLSKAELAYSSGDYSEAYSVASECQSQLGTIVSEANALQQSAGIQATQSFQFTLLTLIAALGILCAGIAAWVVLNRKERRKIDVSTTL